MIYFLLAICYLGFISLGMQNSLFGAAWPAISQDFGVPVSWAGTVSVVFSLSWMAASLQSERLSKYLPTHIVVAAGVTTTSLSLFGYSFTRSLWQMILLAVPFGFGTGTVDTAFNSYVALHYKSRYMSWLHCVWGFGAGLGPYIMGRALDTGSGWYAGYRLVAVTEVGLLAIILASFPLWRRAFPGSGNKDVDESEGQERERDPKKPHSIREIIVIPGVKEVLFAFFAYCVIEQTTMLWMSSYLVGEKGFDSAVAASSVSLFYIGLMIGRAVSGFISARLNDLQIVLCGLVLLVAGLLFLPLGGSWPFFCLFLIGLGCSPIYPCLMRVSPDLFGKDKSRALIGMESASGSIGNLTLPPLFGIVANRTGMSLFQPFLLVMFCMVVIMYIRLRRLPQAARL